ncbi:hypothetical protein, partial [Corynebacterium sp. HMSC074E01]|uniref:hypothetical protein n=2 Tax=unclassified Corynebacterium TaxID=2624378 RepID=UPI001AEFA550
DSRGGIMHIKFADHGVASTAFHAVHKGRCASLPDDEIAFPMSWNSTVFNTGRALADAVVLTNPASITASWQARLRPSAGTPRTQGFFYLQLLAQGTFSLDIESLVDGFMTNRHFPTFTEAAGKIVRNLLW